MSQSDFNAEPASRGGLGVALTVFFLLGLVLTLGAQTVIFRLGGSNEEASVAIKPAKPKDLIQPSPQLEPNEVVSLQLQGLAKNPDEGGIEQCFALASPGNKESTGPVERFAAMLHRAPYDVLLFHHLVLVGKPVITGDSANVIVTLIDANERIFVFQFVLSKQHVEGYENCWMTDAVFPIQQIPDSVPRETPTAQLERESLQYSMTVRTPPSVVGPQVGGGIDG
jgi:hypothetical protein